MAAEKFNKQWTSNTSNLSAEELADLEQARFALAHYGKIYDIFEYATNLTKLANVLETRICGNNPSMALNIYRTSGSSKMEVLFPEIEKVLEAYYGLIDDCAEYPDWQVKIQKELGATVSYVCLTLDENSRDLAVEISPIYRRFDLEKQIYFK